MKINIKLSLFLIIISGIALTACKLVVDLTIKQSLAMDIPVLSITMPAGGETNIYAESTIENQSKQAIGELVNIEQLRLDYILSNLSPNPVNFSIAISTNYSNETANQVVVYSESSYLYDTNQTTFIISNVTLPANGFTNALFVSSSVNPILIEALVFSDKYAIIIGTKIQNSLTFPTVATNDVRIGGQISVRLSKSLNDMPNIVSMFQ